MATVFVFRLTAEAPAATSTEALGQPEASRAVAICT
jgi:hypothetical protein